MKAPPFISYITFNRLGLTARNLEAILSTKQEFEIHIIDNNSCDGTLEYLLSLGDKRIKQVIQLPVNIGPIYAVNKNLSKRKKEQFFFTIDNDVHILTENWLEKYMAVFEAFPELGLLGAQRGYPYPQYLPSVIKREKGSISYLQMERSIPGEIMEFIPGCFQCLRPELIEMTGYWSEENHFGDAELTPRVINYTPYEAGIIPDVSIDMTQEISCNECRAKKYCCLDQNANTCFSIRKRIYMNENFVKEFEWKYFKTFRELAAGNRSVYCASVSDPDSMYKHFYNREWAAENFRYYLTKGNL